MVKFHVITSEEYKEEQKTVTIVYAFHLTPFGKCLIGINDTDKAVLHLSFVDNSESAALDAVRKEWPLSELREDATTTTKEIVGNIFSKDSSATESLDVLLKGTEFQVKVWQSLVNIPRGTTVTYEDVAQMIDNPKAIRAVGNAVSKNRIAYLVPCHRVKGKTGSNKYTWGVERKQNILEFESK